VIIVDIIGAKQYKLPQRISLRSMLLRRLQSVAPTTLVEARALLAALDHATRRAREAALPVRGLLPGPDLLLAVQRIAAGAPASNEAWILARTALQR
jgi:hypothetical protein